MALVSALPQNIDSRNLGETPNNMTLSDATPNDVDLSKRQLSERPAWMAEKMAKIGGKFVSDIAIPGSHYAGYLSYAPGSNGLVPLVRQFEDIRTQLHKGIRWFDFRVAKNENNKFVFSQTALSLNEVYPQLIVIKNFLSTYTKELVILHVEPDSGKTIYPELTTQMLAVFGNMIVNKTQFKTWNFAKLISNNKRVIITGAYAPGTAQQRIPSHDSWAVTKSSGLDVVNNGVEWLKGPGKSFINARELAMLCAAVTPGPPYWYPPWTFAFQTSEGLRTEIEKLTIKINVIYHDYTHQGLISTVINHNDKF